MATDLPSILSFQNLSFDASTTFPLTPSPVTTFGSSLEPSQFIQCSPSPIPSQPRPNPRLKKGTKKVNRIKRPPNAFILFRRHRTQQIAEERKWQGGPKLTQAVLSKRIGTEWKARSEEVNQKWFQMAQEERSIHGERFPNYVYQPSPSRRKAALPTAAPTTGAIRSEKIRYSQNGRRQIQFPIPSSDLPSTASQQLPYEHIMELPSQKMTYGSSTTPNSIPRSMMNFESESFQFKSTSGSQSGIEKDSEKINYIKRPANAFLLFRRHRILQRKEERESQCGSTVHQTDLSKPIGSEWKDLSEEEAQKWYQMAEDQKSIHKERFPDYVGRPYQYRPRNPPLPTQATGAIRSEKMRYSQDGRSTSSRHGGPTVDLQATSLAFARAWKNSNMGNSSNSIQHGTDITLNSQSRVESTSPITERANPSPPSTTFFEDVKLFPPTTQNCFSELYSPMSSLHDSPTSAEWGSELPPLEERNKIPGLDSNTVTWGSSSNLGVESTSSTIGWTNPSPTSPAFFDAGQFLPLNQAPDSCFSELYSPLSSLDDSPLSTEWDEFPLFEDRGRIATSDLSNFPWGIPPAQNPDMFFGPIPGTFNDIDGGSYI